MLPVSLHLVNSWTHFARLLKHIYLTEALTHNDYYLFLDTVYKFFHLLAYLLTYPLRATKLYCLMTGRCVNNFPRVVT